MTDADDIQAQIENHLSDDGQLTCEAAHLVAKQLNVDPLFVGDQATAMDVRITKCQLGFFGYAAKKGMPGYKTVHKLEQIPGDAAAAVCRSAGDGEISCAAVWKIGDARGIARSDMGNIVETLGIKTHPCQLGCF
jgi:hypothetical protein